MSDLEFPKPGKTYKQVKTVSMSLCDSSGTIVGTKVTVYLSTAGTPNFAVGLPKVYADYCEANRRDLLTERDSRYDAKRISIGDGVVSAETFDALEPGLKWLSQKISVSIKNRKINKVLLLSLSLRTPKLSRNPPSFLDNVTHVVGLGASINYEVDGKYYTNRSQERARDPEEGYAPSYEDLSFVSADRGCKALPFTTAAWETLQAVKSTLAGAATALEQLGDPEKAALLLAGGAQALLAGPEAP